MSNTSSVVSVYPNHTDAEAAIKKLHQAGIDLKTLSIVGKDYHTEENAVGYYNIGDRMMYWGKLGAFWGGIWGLLFGSAFFLIPGIGPLVVAGPLVQAIVAVLEGAVVTGGMSALGAGLFSIGIPENSILQYETALKADQFLLVVHGSVQEVARARAILDATNSASIDHYAAA
ncbi:MAG: permease [Candidatus Hydrogenedentes bacterium]|nr:permease [Candidatus Hydrogenedentota bacterium]